MSWCEVIGTGQQGHRQEEKQEKTVAVHRRYERAAPSLLLMNYGRFKMESVEDGEGRC